MEFLKVSLSFYKLFYPGKLERKIHILTKLNFLVNFNLHLFNLTKMIKNILFKFKSLKNN